MRYHSMSVRMTIIKTTRNNKCWRDCEENGKLVDCWWECKLVQSWWKTVRKSLKKLKRELPYDPTISLLGHVSEGSEIIISERYVHLQVNCSIIYNSQNMEKQPK